MITSTSARGSRLTRWWHTVEWPIVWALALGATVLGVIGFHEVSTRSDQGLTVLDLIYLALQLFVLQSGFVPNPVPWQLQVARFLAPGVSVYTATQALAILFSAQLQSLRLRFLKDHVVICGLGRKGLLFARGFRQRGDRVVVVESDPDNERLEACRETGALVVIGNATDPELLSRTRLGRAKYLVTASGDDSVNAEVAVRARDMASSREGGASLACLAHIVDPQLCALLREQVVANEHAPGFRLEFFNVFQNGARTLVEELNAERTGRGSHLRHAVLVGLGRMGEAVVIAAARQRWFQSRGTGEPLRITVVDRAAKTKVESLRMRYPRLDDACHLAPEQLEIESPVFERAAFLFDERGRVDIDAACVCLDDDARGLSAALALSRHLAGTDVPVVVRMAQSRGLAALMGDGGRPASDRLRVFGLLDKTCSPEALGSGTHEVLARAVHENYVRTQRELGATPDINPSTVAWSLLAEPLRESNRQQADHISAKLRAVDCELAPLVDWSEEPHQFSSEEIERLARMEHDRWLDERRKGGWRYASGPKDLMKKTSPSLVGWDDLPEDAKDIDRQTVRALPAFLARAGFRIFRRPRTRH